MKVLLGLIASKGIQVIGALIALRLSTTLLEARELGSLYILRSICAFFSLFLINPITQFILRRTPAWHRSGAMWRNYRMAHWYFIVISLFSALIAYIANRLGIGKGIPLWLFTVLIMAGVYFGALHQWFSISLNILEAQLAFSLQNAMAAVSLLIFPVAIVMLWVPTGPAWFLGQTAGTLVMSAITLTMLRQLFPMAPAPYIFDGHSIFRNRLKIFWSFSGPLFLTTLFIWGQTSGYQLILEQSAGLEFLGLLGLGFAIAANIAGITESIVTQYLIPALVQKADLMDKSNRVAAFGHFFHQTIPVYLALCVFVSFLAEPIVVLLVSEKMKICYPFVVFGIWIEGFRMTTGILNTGSLMEMQPRIAVVPQILGGLLVLVGTSALSFAPAFEETLPYWLVFSGMFLAIYMFVTIRKHLHFPLEPWRFVYILLYSAPFVLSVFLKNSWTTKSGAFGCLCLAGTYFLFILYRFANQQKDPADGDAFQQ